MSVEFWATLCDQKAVKRLRTTKLHYLHITETNLSIADNLFLTA